MFLNKNVSNMKTLFYMLACSCIVITACNSKAAKDPHQQAGDSTAVNSAATGQHPVITFEKLVHNFGEITQGEKVEYSFKFTNTGDKDLLIMSATSTCGCTVPEFPKEPIKPGQSGYLKVIFDSHGKEGYTEKAITIKANTANEIVEGPKIQCNIIVKH
jgi:hypothetical protein